jgi:transaldolase
VRALIAADTINTLPEATLLAWAEAAGSTDGGTPNAGDAGLSADAEAAEACLSEIAVAGVEIGQLADRLQLDGISAFVQSWRHLLRMIAAQRA